MMRSLRRLVGPGTIVCVLVLSVSLAPAAASGARQDAPDTEASERTEQAGQAEREDDRPPVVFQVSPNVTTVGAPVRALVQVEPDAGNRLLRLMVDSGDYYWSSDVQLDGDEAARSHDLLLEGLPAGEYLLMVILYGPDGELARARQNLRLVSSLSGR